jgi:AcrR family transcriptional regulator
MARKLDEEKRKQLLKSALKLFVVQGVQNTSTSEIAKDAGTAAGTLFIYFPTKNDLINQLVLEIAQGQADAINAVLSPTLSAREMFFKIWQSSIAWFLDHMDEYKYVRQVRDSGMIGEPATQESNRYFGFYYHAVEKGRQEGSIQPYPLELIGGFLYQSIVAVMEILKMQPSPKKREEYISLGFEIFWKGIKLEAS